jgi:transposase
MRRGFPGLALQVQETLKRDPHSGHLFVFPGRCGDLIKIIWPSERLSLTINVRSMGKALACSPSVWSAADFCGRRQPMA